MEPGRLIASGRDADIFEFGPDLVLRRTRDGRSLEREARVMAYARRARLSRYRRSTRCAPSGTEIVMERIDGPLMVDAILKRAVDASPTPRARSPTCTISCTRSRRPTGFRSCPTAATALVHLDLHPLNVIVHPERDPSSSTGRTRRAAKALSDVALTYVLLTCPRMPGLDRGRARPRRRCGRVLARAFIRRYRGPALDARIAIAAELKALDANMRARRSRDDEQARRPHASRA